ncbi:unnamed protein product [Allacma fusca]|uniref:CRAL-TRIO domain-containing protein n=1 Tax=Allacma fusca TaxID=39272 RepID=A0A8J2LSL8_9HEXA|nr:unnamed protein product [Allacma fusca]
MQKFPSTVAPTKEEISVIELRQRISDVILTDEKFDDDFYLLQWLKAQKLNPSKAEDMIRQSTKWRQEQKIHSDLDKEFSPEFLKKFVVPFSKTKEGVPVAYFHAGKLDFKTGITTCGKTRWAQYWGMVYTQMEDQMIAFNKVQNKDKTRTLTSDSVCGIIFLLDAQDFSSMQLLDSDVLSCSVENVKNLANYFPALAATAIIYNMNPFFATVSNAFKPFLTWPNLKLEVYGAEEKIWRERVLRIVHSADLNELESYWK